MSDTPEKKVVVLSPAGSKVNPSDVTRQAPAVQQDISDPMKRDTETGSFKKLDPNEQSQTGQKTIKLKPLQPKSPSPESTPSAQPPISPETLQNPSAQGQSLEPSSEEDATIKIERVPKKLTPVHEPSASPTAIPGAKQTIKLRPSSGSETLPSAEPPKPTSASTLKLKPVSPSPSPSIPPQFQQPPGEAIGPSEEQTISMQKKTIRLTPTKPTPSVTPSPAAPTMKLPEEQPTPTTVQPPKPSAPTVKLAPEPAAPSAPTAAPPPPPPPAPEAATQQPAAPKRTLKLKSVSHPTQGTGEQQQVQSLTRTDATPTEPPPTGEGTETGQPKPTSIPEDLSEIKEKAIDEPNIIFTIAAGITFIALAYFAWMNIGQYGEQYLGWESGKVPRLSGQIK